jgi:hypothetical protein
MGSSNIESQDSGRILPASGAFVIAPSDTVDFNQITRGIYVGSTGDVVVLLAKDTAVVTLVAVPAGSLLPLRVKRVNLTGTTASNLVGVF